MKNKFLILFTLTAVVSTAVFCQSNNKPKNIILLIGDGMGMGAVTSSVLMLDNDPFKKFQSIGFSVTCSADALITDSAAGATALATGYKTDKYKISNSHDDKPLKTLLEFAKGKNYSTGIVATISFTNATPACFYAHNRNRDNETEIAKQFLSGRIDVSIASGSEYFPMKLFSPAIKDSITFLDSLKKSGYSVCNSFETLKENKTSEKIFAALDKYMLPKATARNYSLGDMTKIALEKLSKNQNGFVLMVEGSQIDKGEEQNNYDYLLGEQKDFNTAINAALEFAEKDGNTLVVVTADHESGALGILGKERKNINPTWGTKGHSAAMVGIFSYGPGSEKFRGVFENNIIGRMLINFIEPNLEWK